MADWDRRRRGECSNTEWSTYDPSHVSKYTCAIFLGNYRSGTSSLGDLANFSAKPHRLRVSSAGFDKLMLEEDPEGGTNTNDHARYTNDSSWNRVPLAVRDSILSGKFPPTSFPADPYLF